MKRNLKNSFFNIFCIIIILISIACEDDPLLAPQTETEADAGSYGMLYLPNDSDDNKEDNNPEIY